MLGIEAAYAKGGVHQWDDFSSFSYIIPPSSLIWSVMRNAPMLKKVITCSSHQLIDPDLGLPLGDPHRQKLNVWRTIGRMIEQHMF